MTKTAKSPKATKTTSAAKATKAKSADPVAGACPRGGDHEFTGEDDERSCSKCLEPATPPKPKKKPTAKQMAALEAARVARTAKKSGDVATTPTAEKVTKPRKAERESGDGKMSALDAAARVLVEAGAPLNAKQMIEAMASKGYWSSPGGKTPHATLYSAILREINTKGESCRFRKVARGNFEAAS